ncbi:TOG array regulator of axonemal microtubules protein 2 [Frankliniella fusca]|uniref:TOG array regulator of axonemal microtubules protein 2 n=1 Tax=Frankliniella fusca TaxID=407009 RepID=A0AAE1LTL9_9NEOP|nr:TOG array regulator of axonemal microtubules protein 2 [Frankliniella fusca]
MRECALLLLMYAAMTFPSVELDGRWGRVCARVALAARDPRRRVRQAALDALAVLAQFMTAQQMSTALRHAASKQATPMATDAYLAAVQARLARRQLPTVAPNGLILYALQLPANGYRSPQHPSGPDVDWIMAGTGFLSSGSARTREQLVDPTSSSTRDAAGRLSVRPGNPWTDRRWDAPTPIAPTPTLQHRVVIQEEQRSRAVAHGAIPAVNGSAAPQYWGPVDNSEHLFYSTYGMTAAGTRQQLYYRVPPEPHFSPATAGTGATADRGFSLMGRVHPHAQFVCPYPHAYPYPYAYPPHQQQQQHPAGGVESDHLHHHHHHQQQLHQLSQTWPPRGVAPGADPLTASYGAGPPPGSATVAPSPALPRVLSSPTNRRGRRILDPLPYPTGSAPVQSRSSAGGARSSGSSDASPEQRHKMPPLGPQGPQVNGADLSQHNNNINSMNHHYYHLQNGTVERIVHVDDASSRAAAGAGGRAQQRPQPGQRGRPQAPPPGLAPAPAPAAGRLPAPRASALGAGEHPPVAAQEPQHVQHSKDGDDSNNNLGRRSAVVAAAEPEFRDEEADADAAGACCCWLGRRGGGGGGTGLRGRHKSSRVSPGQLPDLWPAPDTLPPLEYQLRQLSPHGLVDQLTLDSMESTSENDLQHHVVPHKPVARQVDPSLGIGGGFPVDTSTSDLTESVDGAGEDAVDGESHPLDSGPGLDSAPACASSAQPVRRVDISPPPKQQSAATRRAAARPGRSVRVPFKLTFDFIEQEAEDLSTALFNRTADTNKFLRADANTALDTMTDNITPSKAVSAIVHKGCRHQNAVVRAAGARLLARLVDKLGVERIMSQPRETRDLLLLTSARLLMEGSLETRSYTKSSLKNLAQDHRLNSILVEIVPSNVMRSIDKTLKSCILRK